MMYVTEQLPGSTYDDSEHPNSLRLFGGKQKKRNTTDMEAKKQIKKIGKRALSTLEKEITVSLPTTSD